MDTVFTTTLTFTNKVTGEKCIQCFALDDSFKDFLLNVYKKEDLEQHVKIEMSQGIVINEEICETDIELVMTQAQCSKEVAKRALEKNNGDIVNAIIEITQ